MNTINDNVILKGVLKVVEQYAPGVPTKCPVHQGRHDYNMTMDNIFTEEDLFWGNFYPPTGFYKFIGNVFLPKDPTALRVEWTIQILTRKGEVAVAEW
jgi:hypothetical protein